MFNFLNQNPIGAAPTQNLFGPSGNQMFSSSSLPNNMATAAPMGALAEVQGVPNYGHAMGSSIMPPSPMPMGGEPQQQEQRPAGDIFNSEVMKALGHGINQG